MEIYFKTKKLEKQCSKQKEAVKAFGLKTAKKLMQRLMELYAAETLDDISYLPPARCHELTGKRRGQFSVDLEHPFRLLFISAVNPVPVKADGGFDRSKITEVEIIEIEDTH